MNEYIITNQTDFYHGFAAGMISIVLLALAGILFSRLCDFIKKKIHKNKDGDTCD